MVGLLLEGGSMRAGFVAGAVMALMDKGMTAFDYSVGVSASASTLAYFAAGQRTSLERVWRDELDSPQLVCYHNLPLTFLHPSIRWPVLDIDYLVKEVFKRKYPLDMQALLKNHMRCGFAVTHLPDAKQVILAPNRRNIYQILKAAMTMPVCCPKPVRIQGEEYIDGGTVNLLPVTHLWPQKVEKLLVILSKPIGYRDGWADFWEEILFRSYFRQFDWMLPAIKKAETIYSQQVSRILKLSANNPSRVFVIYPDKMPPARFITRSRSKINRTIDLGYQKAEQLDSRLRQFLYGHHHFETGYEHLNYGLQPQKIRQRCWN